ncbi:MAG: c-type cytochrome biogenesis protein CcmI [Proteobacteria bacterium]|nr:c-type cytochrome biogenesis protein CcmI [Pseudomonadota bacterium]
MVFWLAALVLVLSAVVVILWPLMARRPGTRALDKALSHYEARKLELDRQLAAREIDARDHSGAMAELGRALLQAEKHQKEGDDLSAALRRRKLAAIVALIGVPMLAVPLYLKLGEAGRKDLPLASRPVPAPQNLDIAAALQQIERHLAKNPNDARGFEVVAPVYMKAGRFEDAARAYRRLVELKGDDSGLLADLGESLVAMGNGVVNDEARKAFERAVTLDQGMAKARFYLALAREQDGDAAGALADLRQLHAALPEGPSRMRVGAEIERLAAESSADPARSIAALPEAERLAAIRGMVDALQARLYEQGGSVEEWGRLVQARIVLKERAAAEAALARARIALAKEGGAATMLDALAGQISTLPQP